MTSKPLPTSRIVLRIVLCLTASAMLLVGAYALYLGGQPSNRTAQEPLQIPLAQMQVVAGKARPSAQGISIESYQDAGPLHYAILSWQGTLSASDYDYVTYQLESAQPAPALNLGWRRKDDLATVHDATLSLSGETRPLTSLRDHPEWHGTIVEFGIHATANSPDIPLRLTELTLLPASTAAELRSSLSAWQHFKGWSHFSINQLYAGKNSQQPTAVQAAAAWAGLALLLALLWQSLSGLSSIAVLCGIALIPWLALDVLWQKSLSAQLMQTHRIFAGKTVEEKHRADQDGYIYEFAQKIKKEVLPEEPARILILLNGKGHHFERLRLQYYLLPHNIYNFNSLPEPGLEHRVDYVIVMGDKLPPGIRTRDRQLFQKNRSLPMQLIKSGSLGHVFRVDHSRMEASQ